MSDLNDNHKRHISVTFKSVDEMLAEVIRLTDGTEAESPFSNLIANATPVQQRVIRDYVAKVRQSMRLILDRLAIAITDRHISSTWAARVTLAGAKIAVEEMRPTYMRGYGEISHSAADDLEAIVAQLRDLLGRMESYLASAQSVDLAARLRQLSAEKEDVQLLRELERIITADGLIEFRAELAMLIERLENAAYEVALFGRVSAGKSSLLDLILETTLLPVGVTPVTSIPTRIQYGEIPQATITFAEQPPLTIDPARLAEFVTEQQNPRNEKHVARIELRLNSPRLHSGVVFVDTPGVGSLAASGAAETQAYLPRCDLGAVLIDSGSTLTPDDLTLIDSIHRSGAEIMILLSKADMLDAPDRQHAIDYCADQIQKNVGIHVPVIPVSIVGDDQMLAQRWFTETLAPRLTNSLRLARESINKKIQTLTHFVIERLKKRLNSPGTSHAISFGGEAIQSLSKLSADIDARRHALPDVLSNSSVLAERILDEAARQIAIAWTSDDSVVQADPAFVQRAAKEHAQSLANLVAKELSDLTARATGALQLIASSSNGHSKLDFDLPRPADLPQWECWVAKGLKLHRPLLAGISSTLAELSAKDQLHAVHDELTESLRLYSKLLQVWRQSAIEELRRAYRAKADLIQDGPEPSNGSGLQTDDDQLRNDISILETALGSS